MEKKPEFDDIRPYDDDEVVPVIDRLLQNSQFREAVHGLFSSEKRIQIEQMMRTFNNRRDFQHLLIKEVVFDLIDKTGNGLTCKNLESISKNTATTYISNHRDIVLDAAILSSLLTSNGYDTVEIAIGDNLLLTDWIKDLVRLNKSFIVKRSLSGRKILENSKHLSDYIHYTIREKNQSVWIAQREGRAKDSNDRTQESVLKMLAMGGDKNFLKNLTELNLTPITFSYEYDPCDYLKAQEFQQKRDNPGFKKTKEDDLLHMKTGLFGTKGRIWLQFGRPINPELMKLDGSLRKNELASLVASMIDKEIFRNYHFYPINYIAYDRLWGKNYFSDKYTAEEVENFEQYIQRQSDMIDLPDKDIPFLTEKLIEMYAYPVKNFLSNSDET